MSDNMTVHVNMLSGGIGSWATGRVVADLIAAPGDRIINLFTNTGVEDADTYRFLGEAADNIGGEFVIVADGRTPFEVFNDEHYLGNDRNAICSKLLKQVPAREWLDSNLDPANTVIYLGIDWTETHRLGPIYSGHAHPLNKCSRSDCRSLFGDDGRLHGPTRCIHLIHDPEQAWTVDAPLTRAPHYSKDDLIEWARGLGLEPPAAYELGLPHANCLAQGCVRGGQAYWAKFREVKPDEFAATAHAEQAIRETEWGEGRAILTDRRGGGRKPMPLPVLAARIDGLPEDEAYDHFDWGGCGCFVDFDAPAEKDHA